MSIENWPRWITASINKHIYDNRQSLTMFAEGETPRKTSASGEFIEVRVNGPHLTEISKGFWRADVVINVLIQSAMSTDLYKIHKDIGKVAAAMTSKIAVYKKNDGAALLGCMNRISVRGSELIIKQHGQLAPEILLQLASVEAQYSLKQDS